MRHIYSGFAGRLLLVALVAVPWAAPRCIANQTVRQSAREIPLVRTVDVVVVGGTLGAVSAAIEASDQGASVLLVAPRTYLGEDLCGTLRLWLEDGETPHGRLTKSIFSEGRNTTPLRVKKALEAAVLAAKVDFLLGCYATDVLLDAKGQPAGVVIANRAGRQAIVAKFVIDCTERAILAETAGAQRRATDPRVLSCRRVVLGGINGHVLPQRSIPAGVATGGHDLLYYE